MNEIKKHTYQYVITTDLLARGIDITGIDVVISYGMPQDLVWYMHRVGRIGRYKSKGDAYIVYKSDCDNQIKKLEKKGLDIKYLNIKKDATMVEKPLELRNKFKKIIYDQETNSEIKKIINIGKIKVQPGYKKKIKMKIDKIKQKKKHEYLEKVIKRNLRRKWSNK